MKFIIDKISKVLGWIILIPVYFYKYFISPLTRSSCRFVPTCSEYAVRAVKVHGPFKGFILSVQRISRCHPWGSSGYDPVPPKIVPKKKEQVKTN